MVEVLLISRIILLVLFPLILWHLHTIKLWSFDKLLAVLVYSFLGLDFAANAYRVASYVIGIL